MLESKHAYIKVKDKTAITVKRQVLGNYDKLKNIKI